MCDAKSKSLIEVPGRIRFHHTQRHSLVSAVSFLDEAMHHLGAIALSLKQGGHEELRKKEGVVFHSAL